MVFLAVLEVASRLIFGFVDYPLPGVEEAAQHIFFHTPERISPIFRVEDDQVRAGWESDTHFLVREQQFPAQRSDEAVRIAFLGGSSVQGWPFREPGGSFPDVVGTLLQERHPDLRVDVINGGVGGYNSFQLVDVAHQLGPLNPDVVVIYAGHNDQGYYGFHQEFLASMQVQSAGPRGWRRLERQANRLNLFRLARRFRDRGVPAPAWSLDEGAEVVGREVFSGAADQRKLLGEERFAKFAQAQGTLAPQLFEANLRELVDMLRDDDTAVVLAPPVSNLRDHAPTEMIHVPTLDPAAAADFDERLYQLKRGMTQAGVGPRTMPSVRERWSRFDDPVAVDWEESSLPPGSDEARAACAPFLEQLDELELISATWAETLFLRGTCLLHSDPGAAVRAFERARDQTYALPPFQRAWATTQEAVWRVGASRGVPVVDVGAALRADADFGVPGGEQFVDNLHFSGRGATVVAEAIADAIGRQAVLRRGPPSDRAADPEPRALHRALAAAAQERRLGMGLEVTGSDPLERTSENDPLPMPCQEPTRTGTLAPGGADGLILGVDAGLDLTVRLDAGPGFETWLTTFDGEVLEGPLSRPVAQWVSPGAGEVMLLVGNTSEEEGPYEVCVAGIPVTAVEEGLALPPLEDD